MMPLIATQKTPCPICNHLYNDIVCIARSPRLHQLKIPISICKSCGFFFICPRWHKEDYDNLMNFWYSEKFTKDPPDSKDENKKYEKWDKMYGRIGKYFQQGVDSLLDVGAGQGWCIEYTKKLYPQVDTYAIERWQSCIEHIENT